MAGYTIRGGVAKARGTKPGALTIDKAKRIPFLPDPLASRPRLFAALVVGLAAGLALFATPNTLLGTTRTILAWDGACLVFLTTTVQGMWGCDVEGMRRRAKTQDEGGGVILVLTLVAAAASIAAIVLELSQAKGAHGLINQLRIALVFATVALSWTFVQMIFALHYAHEYYAPGPGRGKADGIRGGLQFPGGEEPDYWDFLHFSLVIGVASQTADVAFTSKKQRRIGTLHSVVAFTFNTLVLALSINLAASLF